MLQGPTQIFPLVNATLNACAFIFLMLGFYCIRKKKFRNHAKCMLTAFGVSATFLASYLYYHFNYTSPHFQGQGWIRIFYFSLLISHIALSTFLLPFILRVLYLGLNQSFVKHRNMARWVWPIWVYNSLSGVLVYLMLYVLHF